MMLSLWSLDTADNVDYTDVDYLTCLGGVRTKKQRIQRDMRSDKKLSAWKAWQVSSAITTTCRSRSHGMQA